MNVQTQILKHLYEYRCATYTQLLQHYTIKDLDLYEAIELLVSKNWIKRESFSDEGEEVYFLEQAGVKEVKRQLKNTHPELIKKHHTATKLYVKPRFRPHYLATLDFALEAMRTLTHRQLPFQFKNGSWEDQFEPVKPDAIFEIGDTLFLIEIDRQTETLTDLKAKMGRYDCLIRKRSQRTRTDYVHKKMVVLFVYDRLPTPAPRDNLYRALNEGYIERWGGSDEMIAGEHCAIMSIFLDQLVPEALGQIAPYRKEMLSLVQRQPENKGLKACYINTNDLPKGATSDYAIVSQGQTRQIFHRLYIDLTVLRLSRLNSAKSIKGFIRQLEARQQLAPDFKCCLIISDRKMVLTQHFFALLEIQKQSNMEILTEQELALRAK